MWGAYGASVSARGTRQLAAPMLFLSGATVPHGVMLEAVQRAAAIAAARFRWVGEGQG